MINTTYLLRYIVLATLLLFACSLYPQVKINEYSAANKTTLAISGNYYDWVELYNENSSVANLAGLYLSDNPNNLLKWPIPSTATIPANGFLLFFCSGLDGLIIGKYHTNFKLEQSDTAEMLLLSDAGGTILDSVTVYPCRADNSRGRKINGDSTWAVFQTPTPNLNNSLQPSYINYVPKVEFNLAAGFYSGTKYVGLSCAQNNVTIRYTTNGTVPGTTSTLYSGPIAVTATTVIRARAFDNTNQYAASFTETNTYFINETHSLPVISATSGNFNNLFSTGGFKINGNIEFFSTSGTRIFKIGGEFNRHGNDSWAYPQKGIDFNVEDEYGEGDNIECQLFYTSPRDKFKWMILKAAGSDNFPGNSASHPATHIRDAYVQTFAEKMNLNVDVRRCDHALLFINGQYWGLYEYREKVDADYFKYYYNQGEKWVDELEYWGGLTVNYGSDTAWDNLYTYIGANNMSNAAAYQYVAERLDTMSLIDNFILNSYAVNSDWMNWNMAWWRGRKGPDPVKWRYWLWDEDNTFNLGQNYTGWPYGTGMNSYPCDLDLAGYNDYNIGPDEGHIVMLNKLRTNPQFEHTFTERYKYLVTNVLTCPVMLAHLDSMVARIQPEMQRQCTRWSGSYSTWLANINFMRNQIINRCGTIGYGLDSCYGISFPSLIISTAPNCGGTVLVNGELATANPVTVSFFSGTHITLKAQAENGWQFDHWQMGYYTSSPNNNSDSIWFDLDNHTDSIYAVFVPVNPTPGNLYVSINGPGTGTVTINGSPVSNNQVYSYILGTQLNVQAVPQVPYTFGYWQTAYADVQPANAVNARFCFNQNDTLYVFFNDSVIPIKHISVYTALSQGVVTVNGTLVTSWPKVFNFPMHTTVTMDVTPAAGFVFSNWTSNHHTILPSDTDEHVQFSLLTNDSIYAYFTADTIIASSAIKANAENTLIIYPNPSTGKFTIDLPENAINGFALHLTVTDAVGKVVLQQAIESPGKLLSVDLGNAAKGAYSITISKGHKKFSGRVVIE
ncbi:MAG: CotH kinase family protein [Chitinophagales bacterium]